MPWVSPPHAVQDAGMLAVPEATPRTQASLHTPSVPPSGVAKPRHELAHGGVDASRSQGLPSGSPVFAVRTHTFSLGSQRVPVGHWLSSPHDGTQAVWVALSWVQATSGRPLHFVASLISSLRWVSGGPR